MILVTGATGQVGSIVVQELAAKRTPIRALVRNPDKAARIAAQGIEVFVGDLGDPASIEAALVGIERIVLITSNAPDMAELQGNVIAAAKQRGGIQQIVKLSGGNYVGPNAPTEVGVKHWQIEEQLAQSGIPYTCIRSNLFLQTIIQLVHVPLLKFGVLVAPMQEARFAVIDARDVAAALVGAMGNDECLGKTFYVTGPDAFSMTDVAMSLAAATGKPISYMPIPLPLWMGGLKAAGLPQQQIEHYAGLVQLVLKGEMEMITNDFAAITGNSPRPFGEFARGYAQVNGSTIRIPEPMVPPHPTLATNAIKGVGHLAIFVSDLERSRKFYEDVLGMFHSETIEPHMHPLNAATRQTLCFMSFGKQHHDVVLVYETTPDGQPIPVQNHGLMHMALRLDDARSTAEFAQSLLQNGNPIFYGPALHIRGPQGDGLSGGNHAVYIQDPDGHLIEIYQGMNSF
ncbi:MAG: NmrA family NAD(P)-binding protein [Chloroflexi bacterium]|nr:NmrA family NAD(P)-binding protein [Chloroflexota bacterium]MBP8059722.1 NmrA family NAD(P)-binding protein [Chloroflexota bacterium]